jgi:uncharacterized membrane protein YdbT with pleckstrin-like domain
VEPKFDAHPAMFKSHPFWFILSVILVPVGIGIIILLAWYLVAKATRLAIIGSDVVLEKGLLSKERTELSISSIRSVRVYQSFINRICGVGTISVYTAGDRPEMTAAGIPEPNRFRDIVKSR